MGEAGMQGDDADHDQAQRWLSSLRDGTDTEKIAARRGLARVFEQRGMLEEAIALLEANVRAGVRSGENFRWLARLYHEQGDEPRSFEALTEAAKYHPASRTSDALAPADLPIKRVEQASHLFESRSFAPMVTLAGLGSVDGSSSPGGPGG
jgi:predicted Zn-dependent protease